ncbi:MAG TPA: hypothetical protein PLZ57_13875 [Pseudobdellovibrionaceae bacterium]|nr:hypothetical protein [Pseudobdellovibrionaceae bacterium]
MRKSGWISTKVLVMRACASLALLSLSSCAFVQRSPGSGYAFREQEEAFGTQSVQKDREREFAAKAQIELGGRADSRSLEKRQLLLKAERRLEGKQERERYFEAKPYLRSDDERLHYLNLESSVARERFLSARKIGGEKIDHPPDVQMLIGQNDIMLGMTRAAVRDSWGPPDEVEVAGQPMYGNERWHYTEQVTSSEGYATERRIVIFEAGRVVGWETN